MAPAIMRVPGRVHISWTDDNTLKVDTDAGTQTRVFHFGASQRRRSAELAGIFDSELGWAEACSSRWRRSSAGRLAKGCHHHYEAGLLAQKRRAL
jgi:hypothetical protein